MLFHVYRSLSCFMTNLVSLARDQRYLHLLVSIKHYVDSEVIWESLNKFGSHCCYCNLYFERRQNNGYGIFYANVTYINDSSELLVIKKNYYRRKLFILPTRLIDEIQYKGFRLVHHSICILYISSWVRESTELCSKFDITWSLEYQKERQKKGNTTAHARSQ